MLLLLRDVATKVHLPDRSRQVGRWQRAGNRDIARTTFGPAGAGAGASQPAPMMRAAAAEV
eukprot:COSAG01_NODE_24574_length_774_cov_1.091852_2_plen_60_part_01